MLKTRVITALVLLVVILPVVFSGSPLVMTIFCAIFFGVASWEALRLFKSRQSVLSSLLWTALFVWLALMGNVVQLMLISMLASFAWVLLFIPLLKFGLPDREGVANRIISIFYLISLLATLLAILSFQQHSPVYLLSVMAIVWVADIGAYFFGKAFGKHKLAPTISPGKSWEGAIGGSVCVVLFGLLSTQFTFLTDSFAAHLQQKMGWFILCVVLVLLSAISVAGDLIESQLKRRAAVKDSSHLLPGHGGVLDRIDALISVSPFAILIEIAMNLIK